MSDVKFPVVLLEPVGVSVYVLVPVPPFTNEVMLALFPPKHKTFVDVTLVQVSCEGCVIFTVVEMLHPFASLAIMV